MKRVLCWLLLLLTCLTCLTSALSDSAYSADGLCYDDGSLSVRIQQTVYLDTNITMVYVTCQDASQLRTALAGRFPTKATKPVDVMAREQGAVLAINGDFFTYHNKGVVVRGGELLRNQPRRERDSLIIDAAGDMTILTDTSAATIAPWLDTAREIFCFGPGLIVDGEAQTFRASDKVSCGANTKAQRIALCQMGPLSYLIVATEGPEQDPAAGLSLPEFTALLMTTGCTQAYNLDGGSSVTVIFGGRRINAPDTKNRAVSDIIYFVPAE